MDKESEQRRVIVAVPADAALELEREALAERLPVFRGAALDAVVSVGTDAAVLVTLLQAPEAVRAFAAWIRARCAHSDTSVEITVRRGSQRLHVDADGDISIEKVADFLASAFKEADGSS
jgi:hypothetical protein